MRQCSGVCDERVRQCAGVRDSAGVCEILQDELQSRLSDYGRGEAARVYETVYKQSSVRQCVRETEWDRVGVRKSENFRREKHRRKKKSETV